MCQTLALTVLYTPDSELDCLIYARLWPRLCYMRQNVALTVLYADLGAAFSPPGPLPETVRFNRQLGF